MSIKVTFKWVTFIDYPEEYAGRYANSKLAISSTPSSIDLEKLTKTLKCVENNKDLRIMSGEHCNYILIAGLNKRITLTSFLEIDDYSNPFMVVNKGPTLQWLLDSIGILNTFNPDKMLYVDSIAVQFVQYKNTVRVAILNTDDTMYILDGIENKQIEWLGNKTFDEFLEPYGYVNEAVSKNIATVLIVYQAAKELEFKDPKEVVEYFYDKRLIAELTLKGVFDKL